MLIDPESVGLVFSIQLLFTPTRVTLRPQGIQIQFPLRGRHLRYDDIRDVASSVEDPDSAERTNVITIRMKNGRCHKLKNFAGSVEQLERAIRVALAASRRTAQFPTATDGNTGNMGDSESGRMSSERLSHQRNKD